MSRSASRRTIGILTSWPLTTLAGSGVVESIRGFAFGLDALGQNVQFVAPSRPTRTVTGTFLKRVFYNGTLPRRIRRAKAGGHLDTLLGFDFDGCYLEPRWRPSLTAVCGGTLADILEYEKGWPRGLLRIQARMEGQNIRGAEKVVVPSRYAAEAVMRLYQPARSPEIVPLAIDAAAWEKVVAVAPSPPPPSPVVLSVARFYRRKGLDLLIRAWARVRRRLGEGTLVLVGSGPQEAGLKRLSRDLGVASDVTFAGPIAHRGTLKGWYETADLFALPSRQETFGLVLLEAGLHGLGVVALNSTAVPEVVGHGENGLLVEAAGDEEIAAGLAATLQDLLADTAAADSLGEAGRRRARARSWTDAAADLMDVMPP